MKKDKPKGNTGRIAKADPKQIWPLPELSSYKSNRIFTRHWTNLSFVLDHNLYALLSFLVYQSLPNNTFKYSTLLLEKYNAAAEAARCHYTRDKHTRLNTSIPNTRKYLETLIELSIIIPTHKKQLFLINPLLTYTHSILYPITHKQFITRYNNLSSIHFSAHNQSADNTQVSNNTLNNPQNRSLKHDLVLWAKDYIHACTSTRISKINP